MNTQVHVEALLKRWQQDVTELTERFAQPALAALTSTHIRELQEALKQEDDELLNLSEAAAVSNYSADYLGRLVRQGKLENCGRPNAPKVRRGDLPRRTHLHEPESDVSSCPRRRIVLAARSD